jgi:CRISPR-associated endonuclease Cas1
VNYCIAVYNYDIRTNIKEREGVIMQLVINTYGSYLRKKGNCFLVRKEDEVFEVSVNKVDRILITTAAYISTDAIKFAVDNNINIVFLDSYGDPYGRVWHPKLGSTTLIRRRQLELYKKEEGLKRAKKRGIQCVNELADKIITMLGKNLKSVHDLPIPSDIKHSLADISSKAEKELKYKPEYNLDNGLKETIWFLKEWRG